MLRALATEWAVPGFVFPDLATLRAGIAEKAVQVTKGHGVEPAGNGLELVASQAIYRVDGVTRRSEALQAHPLTVGARVVLNAVDAAAAGLADGAMAKLRNAVGTAAMPVRIDAQVVAGCVWIETGYGATAPLAASARVEVVRA